MYTYRLPADYADGQEIIFDKTSAFPSSWELSTEEMFSLACCIYTQLRVH